MDTRRLKSGTVEGVGRTDGRQDEVTEDGLGTRVSTGEVTTSQSRGEDEPVPHEVEGV